MDASYHNCAGQTFILETQIVSWHLAGQSYDAHLGIWTFCGLRKACVCLIRSLCCVGKQWPRVIAEWLSNDTKAIVVLFHLFQQHRFPQLLLAWSEFGKRSVTTFNKIIVDCILARLLCRPGWSMKCVWRTKYLHFVSSWFFLILLSEILWHALTHSFLFLTTSERNIKSVYYLHIYHPPTELREGNVFSCVSVIWSVHRSGVPMWPLPMMPWTSLYRASSSQTSDLGPSCPQYLDIRPGNPTSPSLCCYWHLVAITGDLFKHVHLRNPLPRMTSGGGHWRTYGF